jgi:ethanolamine ammonia-lyase small subunit
VTDTDPWAAFRPLTPARIGLGHVGGSLPTAAHLAFQLAPARARDAVHGVLDLASLITDLRGAGLHAVAVRPAASTPVEHLRRPDLGRKLDPDSRRDLIRVAQAQPNAQPPELVFLVAGGLSAAGVQRHAVPLLALLVPVLAQEDWRIGPVVVTEHGRVALGDEVGQLLRARLVAVLIGERPGLSSPDSLGVYLTWEPKVGRTDAERNCVSNVRPDGLQYRPAADRIRFLLTEARRRKLTGVALKTDGLPGVSTPAPIQSP